MESELNITDGCLLTPRWLKENVYYIESRRIYRNADHCLHVPMNGYTGASKKRELLPLTVIYSCAHLVYMTSTN